MAGKRGSRTGLLMAVVLTVFAAGCRMPAGGATGASSGVDPCAERLHDISGHLLIYYSANRRLPASLDELRALVGPDGPPLVCPLSGLPYTYDPSGPEVPGQPGRLLLYDSEPTHAGARWGIVMAEPAGAAPLTSRVVLLPEDLIVAAP